MTIKRTTSPIRYPKIQSRPMMLDGEQTEYRVNSSSQKAVTLRRILRRVPEGKGR